MVVFGAETNIICKEFNTKTLPLEYIDKRKGYDYFAINIGSFFLFTV
jgi:hypothetical protein